MQTDETKKITRLCGKCGSKLFADAPKGLCPLCLLDTAIDLVVAEDEEEFADVSHGSRPGHPTNALRDVGDYELLEEIGRGAQGVVYRARQKSLDRIVALKIIGLGHWATKAHLKRFRFEAKAAASLDHPSIVPIHEIGESDGSCYFSMQLIEGGQLDQVLNCESMPVRQAAELIVKLARTVSHAHQHGVLHRDIKPGNVLLDSKGEPHLTDFGLARLLETENTSTGTTDALGTPSYMAPEQARGNPPQGPAVFSPPNSAKLTTATDVYGLGAVLYHLLTGQPPFTGGTTYETIRLLLETEPRQPRLLNPKVDRNLSTICLKCLEKDPRRRYSSSLALAEDLERWLRHEPIHARHIGILARASKWIQREAVAAALIASLVALTAAVAVIVWKSDLVARPRITGIAVLPFENLSNDREDASFADGVQDDLLTKLANIATLKVISRTSVMQYRPAAAGRNMRQMADALRVSHVLEGSVRKTGAWLRVNAQLIDARTDSHVWAKQYDGGLKDIFAIQSEIAQKVAEELHVKISATEKAAIERPQTANVTAFDLYSRAKNLLLMTTFNASAKANLLEAADLLNQAVTHDPSYFQAYCQLAYAHDLLHFFAFDRTPERLALANAAVDSAFRLRPDAGEAHLARAENLYRGYRDYNGALAELEAAGKTLPNDPRVFELKGYIERRRGNQQEALRNLERAIDLDPRNVLTLQQLAISCGSLRRYAEERSVRDRVLAIEPDDIVTKTARALLELNWKADTRPLHQLIDSIRATNPASLPTIGNGLLVCPLAERDGPAAKNALIALGEIPLNDGPVQFSRLFVEGVIARMMNDHDKALTAFTTARAKQEKIVQAQPDYGPPLCVLGLIDAALGRRQEALREGKRAVDLLPVGRDAISGPVMIKYLAMIAAWVGDKDLACEQLASAVGRGSLVSYGDLKLLPLWDPLRGHPRFEKTVASLAPKETN